MIQAQSCIAEAFATIEREHMTPTTQPEPTIQIVRPEDIAWLRNQPEACSIRNERWIATVDKLQGELAEAKATIHRLKLKEILLEEIMERAPESLI